MTMKIVNYLGNGGCEVACRWDYNEVRDCLVVILAAMLGVSFFFGILGFELRASHLLADILLPEPLHQPLAANLRFSQFQSAYIRATGTYRYPVLKDEQIRVG
jgi:hypothetical protein